MVMEESIPYVDATVCVSERYRHIHQMSVLRDRLRQKPELHYLFLELCDKCNLSCLHCGSSCEISNSCYLDIRAIKRLIRSVSVHEPAVHICLTGGEPLLHPGFKDIVCELEDVGLYWSVVTNGTIISEDMASFLKKSRVYSVSVSLDGDEEEHNRLRNSETAFQKALIGIRNLKKSGIRVQVTTVISKRTLNQIDAIEKIVQDLGVCSWKLINIEPIGRALENRELLLDQNSFLEFLGIIKQKRIAARIHNDQMNITYGCSHFLPPLFEEEVRKSPFLCGAGILIAGIRCNGDISACLDIERRPSLVQGNIYKDDFWEVWTNRFQFFRCDRTKGSLICSTCGLREVCGGDSLHTWDFDKKEPRMCIMRPF